jgi:hypothetical protein
VLLYPKGGNIASARVIGVRQEKLYMMIFQAVGALTCSTYQQQRFVRDLAQEDGSPSSWGTEDTEGHYHRFARFQY